MDKLTPTTAAARWRWCCGCICVHNWKREKGEDICTVAEGTIIANVHYFHLSYYSLQVGPKRKARCAYRLSKVSVLPTFWCGTAETHHMLRKFDPSAKILGVRLGSFQNLTGQNPYFPRQMEPQYS